MTTIKESAQAYEPPQTKNVSDLEKVSVNLEVKEETHTTKEGKEFKVKIVEVDGIKYRVPNTVLEGMKILMDKKVPMNYIKVLKSGEGMNTKYQVVPLES